MIPKSAKSFQILENDSNGWRSVTDYQVVTEDVVFVLE
jgi:hypothetical protein